MMIRLTSWLSLAALLLALAPAHAEPPGRSGEGRPRPDAPQGERARPEEGRRDDQGNRPPPRLSPEERRELRQQIHEAGHDLYRKPKRQGQGQGQGPSPAPGQGQ